MVRGTLVDRYLQAGTRLIELLDQAGVQASGALWLYSSEFEKWQLILALPEVAQSGPRTAYRHVGDVFRQNAVALQPLDLEDITVRAPDNSPFDVLHGLVNPTSPRSPIQFARQRIQGANGKLLDVEDSWIYRAS